MCGRLSQKVVVRGGLPDASAGRFPEALGYPDVTVGACLVAGAGRYSRGLRGVCVIAYANPRCTTA